MSLEFVVRPGEGDAPVSGAACWAYTLYIKVSDLKMLLQVKIGNKTLTVTALN